VSQSDELYVRNERFAASFDKGDLPIKPSLAMIILTCVDARVDPAHFAGLQLGDALVLRTAGARVTEAAGLEIGILWALMGMASGETPDLELAIIQHTRCGMARFAEPDVAAMVTEHFGSGDVVDTYAISDLDASLSADVERLRSQPNVPGELVVSGHIYDIASGRLTQVMPPAPLG